MALAKRRPSRGQSPFLSASRKSSRCSIGFVPVEVAFLQGGARQRQRCGAGGSGGVGRSGRPLDFAEQPAPGRGRGPVEFGPERGGIEVQLNGEREQPGTAAEIVSPYRCEGEFGHGGVPDCGIGLGHYVSLFVPAWARRTADCSSTAWGPSPVSTRTVGSQITFIPPGLGATVSTL